MALRHAKKSRDLYKMHLTLMSFGAQKTSLSFSSLRLKGFGRLRNCKDDKRAEKKALLKALLPVLLVVHREWRK